MKDGPCRAGVKCVLARWYLLELGVQRWWRRRRGDPVYVLAGACSSCGACCESPMIRVPAPLFYLRSLRLLFLWWQRSVNGFERLAEDRRGRTFVFRCTHFDPITRLCDSYASRPGMCRDYPRVLLDGPAPEFLPGCTHRAVDPGAASFREALDELDLDPDVRARVEERLHLRE